MKKLITCVFGITLVLSLFMIPVSNVHASPGIYYPPRPVWDSPVVTPVSGDKDFTTKVISPSTLSEMTAVTSGGLVVPSGFPVAQKQFGGDAVIVNDFDAGTASACFYFPTYQYGWDGGIHQWNGSRWVPLPSTLIEGTDGGYARVCATITGNGSYSLIIGFDHPEKNVVAPKPR